MIHNKEKSMQHDSVRINVHHSHTHLPFWFKLMVLACLIMLATYAFADGSDLLQGTDTSFWTTLNGTGKKYIYGTEFILAVATYIKSKNLLVFVGVIVIAVFFNVLLKFVGQ
jgi:hypothetical protein